MNNKDVLLNNLVIIFIFILIIINIIYLHYQIYWLKKTNQILEKNDSVNREVITEYQIIKHNIENKLIGLKSVPEKDKNNMINEIIKEQNESFYVKNDINSIPEGISGLIFEILYQYKEDNINVKIDNKIEDNILKKIGLKKYNKLCDYIGVLLKNALEASRESKEKIVYITFKSKDNFIIIEVMNTFSGKINIDNIGKKEYTTKTKGHGIGLYSLLNKKSIKLDLTIKNNYFISSIHIKKAK